MASSRSLPSRPNPLLQEEHTPPVEVLIERRALGSTELKAKPGMVGISNATKPENLGNFDYLHLRVPLPKNLKGSEIFPSGATPTPQGYYLMRRSIDGFVSVTGMFKAAYPWASKIEEDAERRYLSSSSEADHDETAGNVWAAPEFALDLADEYGITDWIVALLDPHTIHDADPAISSPPNFKASRAKSSVNENMSTRRTASRDLRSASPAKTSAPTPNRPKATPRKRKTTKRTNATPSVADSAASDAEDGDALYVDEKTVQDAIDEAAEDAAEDMAETAAAMIAGDEALESDRVRVSVTADVVPGDDGTETTRTNVKVELPKESKELKLPKDTEGVVEMARDIIEAAKGMEKDNGKGSAAPGGKKKDLKRKAAAALEDDAEAHGPEEIIQEVAEGDATELANGAVEMHGRPTKRTRVMVPAEEYRREKVKRRALMGLSGALAVGVMIPFLQNLL